MFQTVNGIAVSWNLENKTLRTRKTKAPFCRAKPTPSFNPSIPSRIRKTLRRNRNPTHFFNRLQPANQSAKLSRLLEEDAGGDGTDESDARADLEA
jgi:hypothetical protein